LNKVSTEGRWLGPRWGYSSCERPSLLCTALPS
jgi:hypothetical protein